MVQWNTFAWLNLRHVPFDLRWPWRMKIANKLKNVVGLMEKEEKGKTKQK